MGGVIVRQNGGSIEVFSKGMLDFRPICGVRLNGIACKSLLINIL